MEQTDNLKKMLKQVMCISACTLVLVGLFIGQNMHHALDLRSRMDTEMYNLRIQMNNDTGKLHYQMLMDTSDLHKKMDELLKELDDLKHKLEEMKRKQD